MLAYNAYTLRQAVDQLMLLLGQHRTAVNLDLGTAILMVNRGWKHVATRLIPLQEWMWFERMNVEWGTQLPPNFLRPRRALLSPTGEPPYVEARYVDIREFWTLSDWYRGQVWNSATLLSPIYTIAGVRDTTGTATGPIQLAFYSAPYNMDTPDSLPPGFSKPIPDEVGVDYLKGIFEYYAMPRDVVDMDEEIPLPLEFQNYAIYVAMLYAVMKYNPQALGAIAQVVAKVEQELKEAIVRQRREKREQLGSFVEALTVLGTEPTKQTKQQAAEQKDVQGE